MHRTCTPPILYFGTPVVLVSTVNPDGSFNLAPISSVFWLGWRCVIGIGTTAQTAQNLLRTRSCVLNLPSVNEAAAVNKLALTTGADPVPESKRRRGYRYAHDKFGVAGLQSVSSELVAAPAVAECPVHMEALVVASHLLAEDEPGLQGRIVTIELNIARVRIDESILVPGSPDRVDPDRWRPLIMSFQQFYGLGSRVHPSALAQIPERLYT